jgi:hypothetical protein
MRPPEEQVEQRLDPLQAYLGTGLDERGLVVVAEDPAIEGRQRDIDACRPEVGDEDMAGVATEREMARRPSACARAGIAFADESTIDHLADAAGNDRPTEPGVLDELSPRPRPTEPDLVEDDDERVEDLVG